MGSTDPKAFVRLNGKSLLARSLETIISSGVASTIVVAAPEEFLMRARREIDSIALLCHGNSGTAFAGIEVTAVAGGNDRIESVQLALKHVGAAEIVLVHDAARALTPSEVFHRVVAAVRAGAEAVVPVLPMTDTVRRAEARPAQSQPGTNPERAGAQTERETNGWQVLVDSDAEIDQNLPTVEILHGDLDRSSLRRVQTPQGFMASTLRRAHAYYREEVRELAQQAAEATDDAGLVERLGVDIVAVDGDEEALKITYPLDLVLGEHIAATRDEHLTTVRDERLTATRDEHLAVVRDKTNERGEQS